MVLVVAWAAYYWGYATDWRLSSLVYGMLFVAALFALVLVHEVGHALMAREHGLRVRDITLLPFGGVARIEQMPPSPRVEVAVALAGPLANLAVAVLITPLLLVLLTIHGVRSIADLAAYSLHQASLTGFLLYILFASLLLGVINLLPAFPMDGGRILRASLSRVIGREQATRGAVAISVTTAGVAGTIALLRGDLIIPIVAIALIAAALAEGRAVRIEEQLRRLQVGQFAIWDRGGLSPQDPVSLALRDGPRDIVVTSEGLVLGMLWREDLQEALQHGAIASKVGELMDRDIITAEAGTSVFDVHALMANHGQWTMPITEHGQYRGIFSSERFSHVHHYLKSRTPESRHVANLTGSVSEALRGFVR
jgi:Zn-dependent protease